MRDFEYEAPLSLAEAVEVLSRQNGAARPLAGGTDLIDHVRTGRLTPDVIVDVKKIPELNVLETWGSLTGCPDGGEARARQAGRLPYEAAGLRLGAAVPCYRIYEDEYIRENYSALADSCRIIGGIQIQNRASVGGNLCNSGPAADSTPALIALGAICVIAGPVSGEWWSGGVVSGNAGAANSALLTTHRSPVTSASGPSLPSDPATRMREVPVEQFCTAPGKNVLQRGELLVELRFPPRPPHSGSHYRRFIPRNEMDIAVVGVGASVTLDETGETFVSARIGVGAVAPTPLFAREAGDLLAGQPVNDASIARAAEAVRAIARPIDDMRGTREFRTHVTGVLTERVLRQAVERARSGIKR